MQGRLTRRIRPSHLVNILVFACGRLHKRRPVVDSPSGQLLGARQVQLAILHTGTQQDDVARNLPAIPHLHVTVLAIDAQARRPLRNELRAEPRGLYQRPPSHVGSRNPGRESKIVLNPRRGSGLSARSLRLNHQGL